MRATLMYYQDKLGFDCLGTWQDPPVYAIVARDEHRIHFRCADPPAPNPDKYDDELLDAYLFVDDANAIASWISVIPASAAGAPSFSTASSLA